MTGKRYSVFVYNSDGEKLADWSDCQLSSFDWQMNGGLGNLTINLVRKASDIGEKNDIEVNNEVKVYAKSKFYENKQIYDGYISKYSLKLQGAKHLYTIECLGYHQRFADLILRDTNTGQDDITVSPDADPETTTVDGDVRRLQGNGETFANLRSGAGTHANDDSGYTSLYLVSHLPTDKFQQLNRAIFLFDTSDIPDDATILSARISLFVASKSNNLDQSVGVTSASPASDTALATADFAVANFGSTRFAGDINIDGLTIGQYHDWVLNSSGIANISLTGISKFAMRLSSDIDNSAPTWQSLKSSFILFHSADSVHPPKLIVTYNSPSETGDVETTTISYSKKDLSIILRDILDKANLLVTYSDTSIDFTSRQITYSFVQNYVKEAVEAIIKLSPYRFYWYVDPTNTFYYKRADDSTVDHELDLSDAVKVVEFSKSLENLKNAVYFTGGGDTPLYIKRKHQGSIDDYGERDERMQDERVTIPATASSKSSRFLNLNSSPLIEGTVEVSDPNYPIESFEPGQIVEIHLPGEQKIDTHFDEADFDTDFFNWNVRNLYNIPLQIKKISYRFDSVQLLLGDVETPFGSVVAENREELQQYRTKDVPSIPTT